MKKIYLASFVDLVINIFYRMKFCEQTMIKKTKLSLHLFLLFFFTTSQAQFYGGGPNNCLLDKVNNGVCPNVFLEQVICWLDQSVCHLSDNGESVVLNQKLYHQVYYMSLAEVLNIEAMGFYHYTKINQSTQHELYEYSICLLDSNSCYVKDSGLTIYQPAHINSEICDESDGTCEPPPPDPCPDNDEPCYGGPSDAAICQLMPEACTGHSGH